MADHQLPSLPDPMELLTKEQVAQRLNCSTKTVDRMVKRGHLSKPRHLAPKEPRWFAQDLEVYRYRLLRGDFEGDPQHGVPGPKTDADEEDEPE